MLVPIIDTIPCLLVQYCVNNRLIKIIVPRSQNGQKSQKSRRNIVERPKVVERNYEKIIVITNGTNTSLQIGFNVDLNIGSIDFNKQNLTFYVPAKNSEDDDRFKSSDYDLIKSVKLINRFKYPVVIFKVELNDLANRYNRILTS